MERHFALPVSIAAALHLGILFGIQKSHHIRPDDGERTPPLARDLIPFELAPEPETSSTHAAPGNPVPGDAKPVSPEPPPPTERPEFPVDSPFDPKQFPVNPGIKTSLRPPGPPIGDADGVGRVGVIFRGDQLDNLPRARTQISPQYPGDAKQRGLAGEVLVDFIVDETGAVQSANVVRSTERLFEESALRAVARWRFEPGRRNGKLVRFHLVVPIVFKLDSE